MLFIFIFVQRMPISLCRIGLQQHLHTAAYLRLPLLIFFLSGVNGVQGEAYHMRRSIQLNNISKSDLEDKLYHGERCRWLLSERRGHHLLAGDGKKMIFEFNSRLHPFSSPHWSTYCNIIAVRNRHKSGKVEAVSCMSDMGFSWEWDSSRKKKKKTCQMKNKLF